MAFSLFPSKQDGNHKDNNQPLAILPRVRSTSTTSDCSSVILGQSWNQDQDKNQSRKRKDPPGGENVVVRSDKNLLKPPWMSPGLYKSRLAMTIDHKEQCPAGCGTYLGVGLSKSKKIYSLEFLIHCIQDCNLYKSLDLISDCENCGLKFLNRFSLAQHRNKSTSCFAHNLY